MTIKTFPPMIRTEDHPHPLWRALRVLTRSKLELDKVPMRFLSWEPWVPGDGDNPGLGLT